MGARSAVSWQGREIVLEALPLRISEVVGIRRTHTEQPTTLRQMGPFAKHALRNMGTTALAVTFAVSERRYAQWDGQGWRGILCASQISTAPAPTPGARERARHPRPVWKEGNHIAPPREGARKRQRSATEHGAPEVPQPQKTPRKRPVAFVAKYRIYVLCLSRGALG